MNRAYPTRINWENNPPSIATPLNDTNLNKMDSALYEIDGRVVDFDLTKANQSDLLQSLKTVVYNDNTGVFTFTFWNGNTVTVDLNIEKIPVSFSMSPQGVITMTTADGTQYTADVASLIKTYSFTDSSEIDFTTTTDASGNKTVTASLVAGSITGDKLQPNYLADCTSAKNDAETAAGNASNSATASAGSSQDSEAWAVGTRNGTAVPSTDPAYQNNSKYWAEHGSNSFAGLTDTDFTNLQNGQVPKYNSSTQKWENGTGGGGASALADLSDVSLENLQNLNQLLYDSETGTWMNGFTFYFLNNLLDVSISSPSAGQVLKCSGGALNSWSNASLSKSDVGLANVDNTSDLDKPISTATQTALNAKADALPTVVNDRYLHTNASTGALEWAQVQGGGSSATVLGGTLVAGNTTITFTDNAITATTMIDIFTNDDSVGWISRSVSGTTLTLTFPPQSSDLAVRVRLEETGE